MRQCFKMASTGMRVASVVIFFTYLQLSTVAFAASLLPESNSTAANSSSGSSTARQARNAKDPNFYTVIDIDTSHTSSSASSSSQQLTHQPGRRIQPDPNLPCSGAGTLTRDGCVCLAGYYGTNCEQFHGKCAPGPCLNGGTCHVDLLRLTETCLCPPWLSGNRCQTPNEHSRPASALVKASIPLPYGNQGQGGHRRDGCAYHNCTNGGLCMPSPTGGFSHCKCEPQWTGQFCEQDVNECNIYADACLNGGTCQNTFGSHSCICVNGWTGPRCEVNIDDCASQPCFNGATCHDRVGSFFCECPVGKTGLLCHLEDACRSNPCHEQAICDTSPTDGSYICSCPHGYTGVDCSQDINECLDGSPCEHDGKCVNEPGSFRCDCAPGFTGPRCEMNINECDSDPCQNEGTCLDEKGGYRCLCMKGYTGTHCEHDINECDMAHQPCLNNGTCVNQVNGFTCLCPLGYTGPRCEVNSNECYSNPCHNGGTCIDEVNNFRCHCAIGWFGTHCELSEDDCEKRPCHHGRCIDRHRDFACLCDKGYMGRFCELEIDDCSGNPCVNSGVCQDMVGGYECHCPPGITGRNCELDANDECQSSPCLNEGVCIDRVNGFACQCKNGFKGRYCEVRPEAGDSGGIVDPGREGSGHGHRKESVSPDSLVWVMTVVVVCFILGGLLGVLFTQKRREKIARGITWFPEGFTSTAARNVSTFAAASGQFVRRRGQRGPRGGDDGSGGLGLTATNDPFPISSPGQEMRALAAKFTGGDLLHGDKITDSIYAEPEEDRMWTQQHYEAYAPHNGTQLIQNGGSIYGTSTGPVPLSPTLSGGNAAIDVAGPGGLTPLMVASAYRGPYSIGNSTQPPNNGNKGEDLFLSDSPDAKSDTAVLHNLIRDGAKVDMRAERTGETSLHLAARHARADAAKVLLDNNVDVNVQDFSGRTALHAAIAADARGVFELLIRHRATDLNVSSELDGTTPLILAGRLSMEGMLADLIQANAEVDKADKSGKTALHWAASVNNTQAIKHLISHGANKDAQDEREETPLFLAAREGAYQACRILLEAGANRDIVDHMERLPRDVANERQHADIVELLDTCRSGGAGGPSSIMAASTPSSQSGTSSPPMSTNSINHNFAMKGTSSMKNGAASQQNGYNSLTLPHKSKQQAALDQLAASGAAAGGALTMGRRQAKKRQHSVVGTPQHQQQHHSMHTRVGSMPGIVPPPLPPPRPGTMQHLQQQQQQPGQGIVNHAHSASEPVYEMPLHAPQFMSHTGSYPVNMNSVHPGNQMHHGVGQMSALSPPLTSSTVGSPPGAGSGGCGQPGSSYNAFAPTTPSSIMSMSPNSGLWSPPGGNHAMSPTKTGNNFIYSGIPSSTAPPPPNSGSFHMTMQQNGGTNAAPQAPPSYEQAVQSVNPAQTNQNQNHQLYSIGHDSHYKMPPGHGGQNQFNMGSNQNQQQQQQFTSNGGNNWMATVALNNYLNDSAAYLTPSPDSPESGLGHGLGSPASDHTDQFQCHSAQSQKNNQTSDNMIPLVNLGPSSDESSSLNAPYSSSGWTQQTTTTSDQTSAGAGPQMRPEYIQHVRMNSFQNSAFI